VIPKPIEAEIAALQDLDTAALGARWEKAFGPARAPKRISRDLLLRSLAYHIQEQAEGGLGKAALKRLSLVSDAEGDGGQPSKSEAFRPRPGTRLVREWGGEVHQVSVGEDGFHYRDRQYASLSRIARAITGTNWSGPLFFGLRKASTSTEAPGDGA
jgi:hypothetical protein